MRSHHCIVASGLSVLLLAGCARQPQSGSAATSDTVSSPPETDAASTYHAVYVALGEPLLEAIKDGRADSAALAEQAPQFDRLVEATRSPACDFGVDRSTGIETTLPHLPELRALARALRADAARLLDAGDADAAARRTAAILRMSVHLAGEGQSTIELLTASAIAGLGAEFVIQNKALAGAPWKTDIQNALAEVEKDGTLRSWAILQREGELTAQWVRDGKAPDLSSAGGHNWPGAGQGERDAAADQLLALMAESASAWPGPDAPSRLAEIQSRAAKAAVGELLPQMARIRTTLDGLDAAIAEAKLALRG